LSFTLLIAATINHLIGVIIFIGFLLLFGYGISLNVLLIAPIFVVTGFFALGISWMLSALNVFLRDIGQIIGVFVNIWFFLTPIIYPRYLIPENWQFIYGLNPMIYSVEGYREGLLGAADINIQGLLYLLLLGLLALAVGGLIFKKLKPAFADVL